MALLLLTFIQATLQGGVQGGAKLSSPEPPPAALTQIALSPASSTVSLGASQSYTADGTFSDGSVDDVTSQCAWRSSDIHVATIAAGSVPQLVNTLAQGTVNITCTIGAVVGTATLTVQSVVITTTIIPLGVVGTPYSVTFAASGGSPPYTFSITTGLSNLTGIGLTFTPPTLSGTPTAQGNYGFTVSVHDSVNAIATSSYVLQVSTIVPPVSGGWAKLPQNWVDTHECDPPGGVYDVNKVIHAGTSGDYACSMAGLNQAMLDWATSGLDQSERVKIDSANSPGGQCRITGATGSGTNSQFIVRTKVLNGNPVNKCFVIESSTPNPGGTNVCAGSDNPLQMVRNFGCNNGPAKANMWYLSSNSTFNQGSVIQAGPWDTASGWGINHVVIRDAEIAPQGSVNGGYFVIDFGPRSTVGASRASLPRPDIKNYGTDIGIERSYIHGDADDLTFTSAKDIRILLVVGFFAARSWMAWNYVDRIFCLSGTTGCETILTQGTYVPSGLKFVSNWLEGGMYNQFWGGQIFAPGVTPTVQPSDVEIRKNRITWNQNWMPWKSGCTGTVAQCAVGGRSGRKNTSELKTGLRFLWNGNVIENNIAAGQYGQNMTLNSRNSSGGTWADNYNVQISDMTLTNNVFRSTANGIQLDGRGGGLNVGQGQTWPARRWSFINNLFYHIGATAQVPGGNNGGSSSAISVISGGAAGLPMFVDFVQRINGIARIVERNNGVGMKVSRISVGDPVAMISCATSTAGIDLSSFNTPSPSAAIGPNATADTTDPNGLTLSYPNAGPDTGVLDAVGAGCNVINRQGFPEFFTYAHNTVITVTQSKWPNNPILLTPTPSFMRHSTYQDNLMATSASNFLGMVTAGSSEGQANFSWDTNTLVMDHMTWPFRYAQRGRYTAWNPQCAAQKNCVTGTDQVNSKLWFPAAVVCPGNTVGPDPNACYGFTSMMNGGPFVGNSQNPLVDYSLVPDSPYRAGGPREAHDHTDLGANLPAIQKAMTETKYSGCSSTPTAQNYCGPTGPFPD